ncbi:CLUMA_CG012492, isoform A [Clunio marinus]|uniref:CLUMA_CG012492, isoform A n=1 Tax=Clunio marinus TaxID=568069 RepID=A0A1J1IG26_9DIPT|nr:CLUMA_CG012492, isoform A [Clunio marinus]
MLAMRRESDNLNNSNNNAPHNSYTTNNLPDDNNLTHLNYTHPVHNYSTSSSYSGLQTSSRPSTSTLISSSQNQLEEYVDILQVQQLLLENSTASASTSSTINTVSYTASPSSSATTPSTVTKNIQSRPRVNLQKAAEYNQIQGESPNSRRLLFDYPGSPYLYGNYHHPSPSEDLLLWFGGNSSVH